MGSVLAGSASLRFIANWKAMFLFYAFVAFGSAAFFGYFGLIVFLEFYESQRPSSGTGDRRDIRKLISRCSLWGAFVIGLISLGLYPSR
ncbi:MAG: hypothetical protein DME38_14905 [Verrucomicrobia bacterium]|nr:MAG: hypothetical protein DME38_14905 [Verrucomicrobiota bacterium]